MQQIAGERDRPSRQSLADAHAPVPRFLTRATSAETTVEVSIAPVAAGAERPTRSKRSRARAVRRQRTNGRRRWARAIPVAAALVTVVIFTVASLGSSGPLRRPALPFDIETLASDVGLGIDQVHVQGARRTRADVIFAAIDLDTVRSDLSLDTRAIERRLRRLPWVATASVMRTYPGGLDVVVTERTPVAIMPIAGRDMLLDIDGRVLGPAAATLDGNDAARLIRIGGDGAHKHVARLRTLLDRAPGVAARVVSAERVGGRRWTLTLTNGVVVMLPADTVGTRDADALADVTIPVGGRRLLDIADTVIDARLADRLVVRPAGSSTSNDALQPTASSAGAVRPANQPIVR